MKIKGFWYDGAVICTALAFSVAIITMSAFVNPRLALAELAALAVVLMVAFIRLETARSRYKKFLINLSGKLDYTKEKVLNTFPFPVVVCKEDGTVAWCNERFFNRVSGDSLSEDTHIDTYTNSIGIEAIVQEENTYVFVNDRYYCVSAGNYEYRGEQYYVLYYLDVTQMKKTENEFFLSRPYFLLTEADCAEDSRSDYRDSERVEIKSGVEAAIEDWAAKYSCVMKRVGDDRCLIIARRCDLNKMIEDKFSVLETVRNFEYKGKRIGSSLSIGISGGSSFEKCDKGARKALEMALGRGGDQVALKGKDGYDYFGGVSQTAERKNKVRIRVIASAINEMVKTSDCVVVVGHNFTDLDAIGAAVGVCCAAKALNVDAYIATDSSRSLAGTLLSRLKNKGADFSVIDEKTALEKLTKRSLLVVVDTHIRSFVEFPSLLETEATKVVIDHHRLSVGQIENAVIFHHDPTASSASEMVTELLQYLNPEPDITGFVAEALLSGIMLDTKNFVIRAGVRTFEAAAFLKEKGADTISVKRLFSNSMEDNRLRNRVISQAEEYMNCAVSFADFKTPDIRIISSQAADELLNVSDILASFVMFEDSAGVSISARSLGEVNVQLIMEALGGGGHQTMAAAQLKGCRPSVAKDALLEAIAGYFESIRKE